MTSDWEMVVRVRIKNCMDHDVLDAEQELRSAIKDEGGIMSVIGGWCDEDDLKIISLRPLPPNTDKQP